VILRKSDTIEVLMKKEEIDTIEEIDELIAAVKRHAENQS